MVDVEIALEVDPRSGQQVPFTVRVHVVGVSPILMDKAVEIRPVNSMNLLKYSMWSSSHSLLEASSGERVGRMLPIPVTLDSPSSSKS